MLSSLIQAFFEKFVGGASSRALGGIRCWIFLILILNFLSEDLAGVALLPSELRRSMGVMSLFHTLPGWDRIYSSVPALTALKLVTLAAMGAAMVGWKTKWSVPGAALLGLICGGIMREYSSFFHPYIVPLQLAILLSFLPCGDGFSVDQFLRRKRGESEPLRSPAVYGWSRYACWIVIAGCYLAAGLSKLRNGGMFWWDGLNLKNFILADTMEPKPFHWGLEKFFTDLPLGVFAALGLVGLLTELLYGLVLFARPARLVMPILAVGLHLGILICQRILFFDLILIQAIFLFDFLMTSPGRRGTSGSLRVGEGSPPLTHGHRRGFLVCLGCVMFVLVSWALRIERYPATAWQMFSRRHLSDHIEWQRIFAVYADGKREEVSPDRWLKALPGTRYFGILKREVAVQEAFFGVLLREANRGEPAHPMVSLELVTYTWNFISEPRGPGFGRVKSVWRYPAEPAGRD